MTIFKGSAAGCVHEQTGAHANVVSVQMSEFTADCASILQGLPVADDDTLRSFPK